MANQAERRQITVLFADMVGSSAMATRLDPEEQREIVAAFQAACADEVKRLDGMVAQYLGDGVLAYFGYPIAHEDDAERAIRTGLAILSSVGLRQQSPEAMIQTRIGIATGVVVVGDLVSGGVTQENAAIGETTNLAARLQAAADPNSIVISPLTHQLAGALFDYDDLGRHLLKGFNDPIHLRRVLRPSAIENRFEARSRERLSRLQGRRENLEFLARRWQQSKSGEGCVVLLTGEAGIGKSRLTRALQERLATDDHTRITFHCSPYHQDSALYPVIAYLHRAAGIERDDAPELMLGKLRALVAQSGSTLADEIAMFAALLSIPSGDRTQPAAAPKHGKDYILAALIGLLKRLCARRSVLMLFEDLHWIDPTSLEFLSRIVDEVPALQLLLVATARPEFVAPWPNHRHVSAIGLSRLDRAEGQQLVLNVIEGRSLPDDVMETILSRTDGVPLFIEELTKTIVESGVLREAGNRFELTGPLPALAIPSTLHASLLARLDRLAPVREVAQMAAVIGREFSYGLIADVANRSERYVQDGLAELTKAELIFQRGVPPDSTYVFKHALVQDAAYASLLRPKREQLHVTIAEVLQQQHPDVATRAPEILARHYDAAGMDDRAKTLWIEAGKKSLQKSYYGEAINHFSKALAILRREPPSETRTRLESELVLDQALSVGALKGNGSADLGRVAAEAVRLSAPLGDDPLHFRARWSDWIFHSVTGNLPAATDRSDALVGMANRLQTTDARLQAHHAVWTTSYVRGHVATARAALEVGLALYNFDAHRGHMAMFGAHDPGVCARCTAAGVLFQAGFPDRAARIAEEGLVLGKMLEHPVSQCIGLRMAGFYSMMAGNAREALERSESLIQTAQTFKLSQLLGYGRIVHAWATALLGEPQRGIEEMEAVFRGFIDNRQLAFMPFCGVFIAEAKLEIGCIQEAMDFLDDIQRLADETHQQWFMSEVHRLRAEGLRKRGGQVVLVEQEYRSALALARQQGALMLELRAATGLALHMRGIGGDGAAHALLEPIYRSFTEGHALPDLSAAKALLNELSGAAITGQ